MSDSNKIEVEIAGSFYTLISKKTESEVRTIASYVDDNIRDIRSSNRRLSPLMASNLAAMNIAEEYFDAKDKMEYKEKTYNDLWERAKKPIESYPKLMEENKAQSQTISRLKSEKNLLEQKYDEATETIRQLSKKLEILESDSGDILAKLQSESDEKFNKLKSNYEDTIENLKRESDEKITTLERNSSEKIENLTKKSNEEIATLKNQSSQKIASMEKEYNDKIEILKINSQEEIERLKKEASEKISDIEKSSNEKYENLEKTSNEKIKELSEKVEEVSTTYNINLNLLNEAQEENADSHIKINKLQKELQEIKGKVN